MSGFVGSIFRFLARSGRPTKPDKAPLAHQLAKEMISSEVADEEAATL